MLSITIPQIIQCRNWSRKRKFWRGEIHVMSPCHLTYNCSCSLTGTVYCLAPTTSFNPFLFCPNIAPPFCHLITKIYHSLYSRSSSPSLEQTPASIAQTIWPIQRTHLNLTSCYLATALSLKTENHCSLANPIPIHPLPLTSFPVSTPNTIHHSRLTVCLTPEHVLRKIHHCTFCRKISGRPFLGFYLQNFISQKFWWLFLVIAFFTIFYPSH